MVTSIRYEANSSFRHTSGTVVWPCKSEPTNTGVVWLGIVEPHCSTMMKNNQKTDSLLPVCRRNNGDLHTRGPRNGNWRLRAGLQLDKLAI